MATKTVRVQALNKEEFLQLELNKLVTRLTGRKLHYSVGASWEKAGNEGWNAGIADALADVNRTIKRSKKRQTKEEE